MRRRSVALGAFVPILTLAVVGGFVLHIADRPWPLLVPAFVGCVLVLLGLVYRRRLGRLARGVLGEQVVGGLQSGKVLGGLFLAVVVGLLVWWLWPGSRLWVGYATLGLAAVFFGCASLRLHPAASPAPPEGAWVHPARWILGGLSVLSMSVLTELAPGDLVHGVGGGSDMGTSEALAIAVGIRKVVREEGEQTRETVRDEGEATRGTITDDGQRTREELGAKVEANAEGIAANAELLARAVALLEARESITPSLSPGSDAPPERPPLSDEDKAIFEAATPWADALTRYRIAVAEGDDAEAGRLEPEVERLLGERRAAEDFQFAKARGDRHFYAGRFDEAVGPYREALRARPDEPGVLNNLALSLQRSRRSADHGASLAEAEGLLARALELRRAQHSGDHPDVATSLNNLASVRKALGRAAEAEPLYKQALAMRQRLFEGDHPDVALSLNNLATVRESLGRAAESEPLCVEALAMYRRLYPGDNPEVARSLNNLAMCRKTLGRAAEAEPLLVEALAMYRRLYPGDNPDVALSLNNLAFVRESLGRAEEAEPLYVEALEMYRRLYPGDNPGVARSLNNLAKVRLQQGRAAEAEAMLAEALAINQRLYPGDHPDIAMILFNLAYVRAVQGRWAEALEPSEQAAAMAARCLPETHPDRVLYAENLAFIRAKLGKD